MAINSYTLIAGYNGSPVNIESISVSGGEDLRPFYSRLGAATYYYAEQVKVYTKAYQKVAAGSFAQSGKPSFQWRFPYMGVTSYKYLLETYAQDNATHRGKVTVGARSIEWDVYDDFNADMFLEPVTEAVYLRGTIAYYQNVIATFSVRGTA